MATEYPLQEGDTHESLAQDLLSQTDNPNDVHWSPRPDVYGGGVYVLADEGIAQRVNELRRSRAAEQAELAQQRKAEAEEAEEADADGEEEAEEGDEPAEGAKPLTAAQKRAARKQAAAESAAQDAQE